MWCRNGFPLAVSSCFQINLSDLPPFEPCLKFTERPFGTESHSTQSRPSLLRRTFPPLPYFQMWASTHSWCFWVSQCLIWALFFCFAVSNSWDWIQQLVIGCRRLVAFDGSYSRILTCHDHFAERPWHFSQHQTVRSLLEKPIPDLLGLL